MLGKAEEEIVAEMLFLPWKTELGNLLGSIIVHTVTVVVACKNQHLLRPFIKLLTEPLSLQVHQLCVLVAKSLLLCILSLIEHVCTNNGQRSS